MRGILLTVAAVTTAFSAFAGGQDVLVTIEPHDYELRQDYSQRALTSLSGSRALAFTSTRFGPGLSYDLSRRRAPGHIVAVLNARLNTGRQQIQIPAEYSPESCEYHVLVEHELKHVQRNIQAMIWLKEQIEREEASKPTQEFAGKTPDEVVDLLQVQLDKSKKKYYLKKYSEM